MDANKTREQEFHDARFGQAVDPRDTLAKYYSVTQASTDLFQQEVDRAAGPGRNVLEYGCGTGGDFKHYKRLGCNLYGIDISGEAIKKANAEAAVNGLAAQYSVQDAEKTDFANGTFDLVLGKGILHHLDLDKSLAELARISKREGTCVFSEPLGHNPVINLFRRLTPKLRTDDEHPLLRSDFALMRKYFDTVEVKNFYLFSLLAVGLRKTSLFDWAYGRLLKLDDAIFRAVPWLGAHAWICIIVLKHPRAVPATVR